MTLRSPFHDDLRAAVSALGGLHNAHMHLDRANTLDDGYVDHGRLRVLESSHISLQAKHALIRSVHEGPAYDPDDLRRRLGDVTEVMAAAGTRLADTVVDVTDDRVGTDALDIVRAFAAENAHRIAIRAASYTPMGFRDAEPGRWRVFEEGAKRADFIGSLPEADDRADHPDHIGFDEHLARVLDLARRQGKPLQVHTDQRNHPAEDATERLIAAVRRDGAPASPDGEPMVWAVHAISPATYDEPRFRRFTDGLLETGIGVISCPTAALGMRQLRPVATPAWNSIPRILDLAAAGVPIRLGSDNVADMCSPSTTADLFDEVFVLSAAIRYYKPAILAKIAAGASLSDDDRAELREHLARNDEEIARVLRGANSAAGRAPAARRRAAAG